MAALATGAVATQVVCGVRRVTEPGCGGGVVRVQGVGVPCRVSQGGAHLVGGDECIYGVPLQGAGAGIGRY